MAFVGREPELARLAGALERAAGGGRSKVALVGRSGVGLTRLVDELIGRLTGLPELVVVRGAAQESRLGEPYAALADALGERLRNVADRDLTELVGAGREPLLALLPWLADGLVSADAAGDGPPLVAAADQASRRFTEAVVGLLERLADGGTILLVLEDLHWADPGTRRFIDTLVRIGRPARLCLVVSYRPEELHARHPARPLAEALTLDPGTETVEVPPLGRAQVVRLLEALLGERPSAAFVAAVMEGSGGLPRLVEQLAAVRRDGLRVRLGDPFEEVMRARLEPLSVGAVRSLRLLAAARRPLPVGLLRRVDLPAGPLPEGAIEEAVASGLARLVEREGGQGGQGSGTSDDPSSPGAAGPGAGVARRQALAPTEWVGIADASHGEALERLGLPADQQPIHAALAGALSGHPAEQAWHLEAAMHFAAARNAHLAAGLAAQSIEPGGSALVHFQRALELVEAREARVPGLGVPLSRLLELAAEAAFAADSARRAAGLLEQAIHESILTPSLERAAPATGTRRALEGRLGMLYVRLAEFRSAAGDLEGALAAIDSASEIVPFGDVAGRAHISAVHAQQLMLAGQFVQSTRAAERVRHLAGTSSDVAPADLASATCTLGVDAAYGGDIEAGLALLQDAEGLAARSARLDELMRVYANSMLLFEMDGRLEEALAAAGRGIALCRRWGAEAAYGAFLRGNAAAILLSLGRWAEAEAEARAALEWSPGRLAAFPLHILGAVLVESRADDESGRIVGRILLELESAADGRSASAVQRIAVSHALWRDDPADAVRAARQGWEQVDDRTEWRDVALAASTTAEAAASLSDAARARRDVVTVAAMTELATTAVGEAERRLVGRDGPGGRGPVRQAGLDLATARAHLDRCRGRHDAAAWSAIADGWLELGLPYLAAKARWWEAEAALHCGDREAARTAMGRSWTLAVALPARPLLRELLALSRRARLPSPAGRRKVAALLGPVDGVGPAHVVAVGPGLGGADPTAPRPVLAGLSERLHAPIVSPSDPFNLSPRELEVLGLVVQGGTNRDIAMRLFISERTVGVHVRNILGKLGVGGRIEAANVAIRLGLVPVPVSVRIAPGP